MLHEDEFIMISALQHMAFCERQCALIHLEQQWAENQFTVQGQVLHEKVDAGISEQRNKLFITRSLRIKSDILGLIGIADVVEFFKVKEKGTKIPGIMGRWQPCPVEYKRGKSKKGDTDRVQLCAQAICLEEMMNTSVPKGALYYAKTKRREWVEFDKLLRKKTKEIAKSVHELIDSGKTPLAVYAQKCKRCSLFEICQPKSNRKKAEEFYQQLFVPGKP